MLLIVSLVFLILIFWFGWRLASQRHRLPCPSWLGWLVEMDNPFTTINRSQTIIHHARCEPGHAVIDVGCGPGRVTIPLAQCLGENSSIVALDVQDAMLQKVKQKAEQLKLSTITTVRADIANGTLDDNQFDRVLLNTVLGEIPEQAQAMAKLAAIVKPGGLLSVTELIFDPHYQSQKKVKRLAQDAGLIERETFGTWVAYTMNFEKPTKE